MLTCSQDSRILTLHRNSGNGQIAVIASGKKCSQNAIASFQALEHPYIGQDYFAC
jgi:hypothetical protein